MKNGFARFLPLGALAFALLPLIGLAGVYGLAAAIWLAMWGITQKW